MLNFLKKFFKPKKEQNDPFVTQFIESNSENWDFPFNQISQSETETRGIQEYLKLHPEKEKKFFSKLDAEFEILLQERTKPKFQPLFVWSFASLVLIFLGGLLYFQFYHSKTSLAGFHESHSSAIPENSNFLYIKNLKVGQSLFTQDISGVELYYDENLHFFLGKETHITLEELEDFKISFFIHSGKIEIESKKGNKMSTWWNTKRFSYTPLGTIASLQVSEKLEILEVKEGYFLRKDKQTQEEKLIPKNSKESFVYQSTASNAANSNLRYKIPGIIHLKDGRIFTGYYYEENGMIHLETPTQNLKFMKSEIDSIE